MDGTACFSVAPEIPQIHLQPIPIEQVEALIYSRRYEDAARELLFVLHRLKQGCGLSFYAKTPPPLEALYTRIAAAITALFADPQFALSPDAFVRYAVEHPTLHSIFRASVYGNMDHVLGLIGTRNPANLGSLSFSGAQSIPKLLLCWSMESDIDLDFEAMAAEAPSWVVPAMLGIMSIGGIHTQRAYDRKVALMKLSHLLERSAFRDEMLLAAGDCYMHCSYTDVPYRHEVKKAINRQLRALVASQIDVKETSTNYRKKKRPTIVIPIEWFGSHHAMYRCYAPSIRQLRKRFRVIGIMRSGEVDDQARAEFDKAVVLDPNTIAISQMLTAVQNEKPDIMYYPSIGMAAWWVALSNFRLAPIQVMTPGHPATSHSPVIDYIVSEGELFGDESLYSEKCVHLPRGGARYIKRLGLDLNAVKRLDDGVIRVAVPAMVMKLVPSFLAALRRVWEETTGNGLVEFHFFPNQVATGQHLITKDIRSWIPGAIIHHRDDYQPYMMELGKCHVMLSSFPFGGTNSVVDAFLARVPVVTLEGNQIHERSDAAMIRRIGLPEWLITHSVDEYVAQALHCIKAARDPMWKPFDGTKDVEQEFFGDGPPEVADAFLHAFEDIYEGKFR